MKYNGTIYRPPIEANTLLLPVTEGCSHNSCRFCLMYHNVKFRILSQEEIENWLKEILFDAGEYSKKFRRIYFVGADPFAISAKRLEAIITLVKKYLPNIEIFIMYAAVRNIKAKTDENLKRLKNLGVNDLYVGVECGLDDVLEFLNEGNTVSDIREQCGRLNDLQIRHMDMLMLGTAGKGRGEECAIASADLVNEIKPDTILINTMTAFPETKLAEDIQAGKFTPAGEKEILIEEKIFLENLNLPQTYFWAAHAMDSVRIAGYIGDSKEKMLRILQDNIDTIDEEKFAKTFRRDHI